VLLGPFGEVLTPANHGDGWLFSAEAVENSVCGTGRWLSSVVVARFWLYRRP